MYITLKYLGDDTCTPSARAVLLQYHTFVKYRTNNNFILYTVNSVYH